MVARNCPECQASLGAAGYPVRRSRDWFDWANAWLVLLDEQGEVLRPAILWNDQRTGPQCDAMRTRWGRSA